MFQQIKNFLQCVAQSPIQIPTEEIITIASDLDTYETNDLFANETVIENDWLHSDIKLEPELYYILLVFAGLFLLICIESVIYDSHHDYDNHVYYSENENMVYYYDNRPIGRYRYLCNAQTVNGKRCKRRVINGTRCNLH